MYKTKGFVTIATGNERYFMLAKNLLYSYRQFASKKYPFAIICDKKNEYTAEFDDVVLLEKSYCNFLDKLQIYDHLPYDETIFIDADSLAYGDLDKWWSLFAEADDFSVFGYAWDDLKAGRGWFIPEGIKEFKDKVSFVPDFNGGVYYLRRGEICKEVFRLANYFAENYQEYEFTGFKTPADEPCLALAMAICDCKPLDLQEIAFAPSMEQLKADIIIPKAHYYRNENWDYDVRLIHWSNYKTRQAFYKFETEKLIYMKKNKRNTKFFKFMYTMRLKYYLLRIGDIGVFGWRIINKIKKIIKQRKYS